MSKKKRLLCSNCGQEPISCDSGWGHEFKEGEKIHCKTGLKNGNLHYCDEAEIEDCIMETLRGDADWGREIRSFNNVKEATIIKQ